MTYQKHYQELLTLFEAYLPEAFPKLAPEVATLEEAARYSLMAGGKRLRPILLLSVLEAAGEPLKPALPFAAALEFIHTYSLIHDDLPCMDNDDLRRGKPTNHKVYGEDVALLAGDSLLTEAFRLISAPERLHDYGAVTVLAVVQNLSTQAGNFGMVAGQMADIQADQHQGEPKLLEFIHHHKTGALITSSLELGGLLAGLDQTVVSKLGLFGNALGRCFQIQDDILDLTGTEAAIGKPVGSDQRNQKLTYPSLFGLERSQALAEAAYQEALTQLALTGLKDNRLRQLTDFVLKRNR
ncbi:MAG: hypothetical protein A2600_02010 [Candidatus Lambdaproteobacteria bacterium RIFOXYD1_FULL_56_27]|uniref:Polyprenyl synthetase n=1 Tax=Candidatus Lambdaproteobacteria bacterium RIFOXYD2_FULL_56_26 TaxID=1817773 RepID=A0A1F6GMT6_9PROT|nr:MAG: hypothetical protein A2557_12420 [Candidatus Lambdaproteobacteria bacterium RIFOXYD2_FULL_56_26]OGH05614.1 MAG: hypothetical protein A2426_04800 [Candidatus Lambdaproteobacteria bacterium RIFOXYC1_FULL_56_13]OGH08574.1 MAG: hypothetical protein A2600_02010 [Candidatus Lambdaproteobacteria bacterium RIFOXYD1_FULL_56_27]